MSFCFTWSMRAYCDTEKKPWDRWTRLIQLGVTLCFCPQTKEPNMEKKVPKQSRSFFYVRDVVWEVDVAANCALGFPPLFKPSGQGAVSLWLAESGNTKLLLILSHSRWPESLHQRRRTLSVKLELLRIII